MAAAKLGFVFCAFSFGGRSPGLLCCDGTKVLPSFLFSWLVRLWASAFAPHDFSRHRFRDRIADIERRRT